MVDAADVRDVKDEIRRNGPGVGIAVLVLIGVYYIVQTLTPTLALTDKGYLDRTATAFEKLSTSMDTQTRVLSEISSNTEQTASNTEMIKEQLKIRPADVLEEVKQIGVKIDRLEAAIKDEDGQRSPEK